VSGAFTPGQWQANLPVRSDGALLACHVVTCDGTAVAQIASHDDGETQANARLIAAAPKMYAALTAFEQQWNACGGNSHFGGLFQSVRDAVVEALSEADASHWLNTSRDQLAKARGEA
jgi:hypothetical protein